MKSISNYLIIALIFNILLFSGCGKLVNTTIIKSQPVGAKLFINNEYVGTTPYTFTDTLVKIKETSLRLEKEGYVAYETSIVRDERVTMPSRLFVFYHPRAMKYHPVHEYRLEKIAGNTIIEKADKLREFKKLLDDKLITQEEFDKEKQKILEDK